MTKEPASDLDLALPHEHRFAVGQGIAGPHPQERDEVKSTSFHRIFSVKAEMEIVAVAGRLRATSIFFAEGDPDTVSLSVRPLRVLAPIANRPHYTFDLELRRRDGSSTLYEVASPSTLLAMPDGTREPAHWKAVQAWCRHHGRKARLITDADLQPWKLRTKNARRLLPFVRVYRESPNPTLRSTLQEILETRAGRTVKELETEFARQDRADVFPAVADLLHSGSCSADLNSSEYTVHTPIYLAARSFSGDGDER